MKRKEYDNYLKFIDDSLETAKSIPRYFSKYSNKIYCNHQKFAIYVLMQKFKTTTRGIVSMLRASSDIRMHLGLSKVPVHTTIVRFVNRIKELIHKIFDIKKADAVAMDASGFELESKSYYYRHINKQLFPGFIRKTKNFMKCNILIDIKTHKILSYKLRKSRVHESKDFKHLLKGMDVNYVLADKGYSSRKNRQFVVNKLKAIPVIPKKINEGDYYISSGKKLIFNKKLYGKRSLVENVFFCLKRNYGSVLRNKSSSTQKAELVSKIIAHNIDRMQKGFMHYLGLHQRSE